MPDHSTSARRALFPVPDLSGTIPTDQPLTRFSPVYLSHGAAAELAARHELAADLAVVVLTRDELAVSLARDDAPPAPYSVETAELWRWIDS